MLRKDNLSQNAVLSADGIFIRLVEISDAEFIVNSRNIIRLKQFISETNPEIEKQILWINEYKQREAKGKEFYFVFEDSEHNAWGTIRLYNFENDSFTFGSWVCMPGNKDNIAIKALILTATYGLTELGFKNVIFDSRKKNRTVQRFIRKYFDPVILREDDVNSYFLLTKKQYFEGVKKILETFKIEL